ncbi:uncharacterized protein hdly isoform X1 [Atheta coriaria]|uniref:uncharacterized protein hdly isoform X1 n=2 Tax=Dalotia coriaria TaxID=877792 RepID=UPI0031F475BE
MRCDRGIELDWRDYIMPSFDCIVEWFARKARGASPPQSDKYCEGESCYKWALCVQIRKTMKVSNHTLLLFAGCLLLAVLTERVAHAAPDQYDARHGTPPPPTPPSSPRREATDHSRSHSNVPELNANPDRNHDNDRVKLLLIADTASKDHDHHQHHQTNELGEMQVGCGHGLFEIVPAPKHKKKMIRKRSIEKMKERKRRNYHSTFTVWQPPVYQLTRPYVIPVWGAQGQQHPIYFPPQPIQPDLLGDPRKSYLPPKGYLPPTRSTTIGFDDDDYEDVSSAHGNDGNINLDNRNNFDDAPIWDIEPPIRTTPAPPKRTRRPGVRTTTFPPLVHRSENNTRPNLNAGTGVGNSLRPVQNRPNLVEVPNFRPSQGGTQFGGIPRPTPAPTQPSRAQPSRCVWAIISCCQGNNQNISYSCFEQLGCTGAFWDKSPCDSDFAKAAVDIALQYYSQK